MLDPFDLEVKVTPKKKTVLTKPSNRGSSVDIDGGSNTKKWKVAAHALDTIAKIVLPLLYVVILIALFLRT